MSGEWVNYLTLGRMLKWDFKMKPNIGGLRNIWNIFYQPVFLQPFLTHGVMVALLILVQSVKVRILMGQPRNLVIK